MDGTWTIGRCGVDAGLIMIGDPCYIQSAHNRENMLAHHEKWSEFCDILGKNDHTPMQFGSSVVSPTYGGDGEFPVIAKFENGSPEWLKIDFLKDRYPTMQAKHFKLDLERSRAKKRVVKVRV